MVRAPARLAATKVISFSLNDLPSYREVESLLQKVKIDALNINSNMDSYLSIIPEGTKDKFRSLPMEIRHIIESATFEIPSESTDFSTMLSFCFRLHKAAAKSDNLMIKLGVLATPHSLQTLDYETRRLHQNLYGLSGHLHSAIIDLSFKVEETIEELFLKLIELEFTVTYDNENQFDERNILQISKNKLLRKHYVNEGVILEDPVHPGKILEKYIIDQELSAVQAAAQFGVSREHLYSIMRGDTGISTSTARALERNQIGGTALDWLVLQAKYDLAQPERPPTPKRRLGRVPKN